MKAYKKKKEELIFLKEINSLLINAKQLEKVYLMTKNKSSEKKKEDNGKNSFLDTKKVLEKQMRSLKSILNNLENNYGNNLTYPEIIKDNILSKENRYITEEISNNIIELYLSKKFNLCYNLWRKYDFQKLIGISEERNFDLLNYLNKLRDRYDTRNNLIEKTSEINSIKDNNLNDNYYLKNQNQSYYSKENLQNISISQNYSQMSNNDNYNLKLSENEKMLQILKRQLNNIKSNNKIK